MIVSILWISILALRHTLGLVRSVKPDATAVRESLKERLTVWAERIDLELAVFVVRRLLVEISCSDAAFSEAFESTKVAYATSVTYEGKSEHSLQEVLELDGDLVGLSRLEAGPVTRNRQHPPNDPHHQGQIGEGTGLIGDMLPVDVGHGIFDSPSNCHEQRRLSAVVRGRGLVRQRLFLWIS